MEISLFKLRFAGILTARERIEKFALHLWQETEWNSGYFEIGQVFAVSKFREQLMKTVKPRFQVK
jgi:hypothetical protein